MPSTSVASKNASAGTERNSWFSFLKKAWQDTFLALTPPGQRDEYHFGHYFLGWPKRGSKGAYFITAKFISTPLFNLVTLLTEFPFNLLSESFAFVKSKINSWSPTHGFGKAVRALCSAPFAGLQGLFKGLSFLVRTITSPLVSYHAAKEVHPVLGVVSALASTLLLAGLFATLVFFAPPIFAALTPAFGSIAVPLIKALAFPILELLSLTPFTIPAACAAMVSLLAGTVTAAGLHLLGRAVIYPPSESPPVPPQEEAGTNVGRLLPRSSAAPAAGPECDPQHDHFVAQSSPMLKTSFGKIPEKKEVDASFNFETLPVKINHFS